MDDGSGKGLRDLKFFCFDGEPKFLYVSEGLDRHETAKVSFVTKDWQPTPFRRIDYQSFTELPEKPKMLDRMLEIAGQIAQDHPFLRVDLYNIGERIYFGELTFFHCAGYMKFVPEEWDTTLGNWIVLPERK